MKKVSQLIKEINKNKSNPEKLDSTPSGFKKLDNQTGGFRNGKLTILAARQSMEATTLALNFATNIGQLSNKAVLIFSLDSSAKTIAKRIVGMNKNSESENDVNIYIEDTPNISIMMIMEFVSKMRQELEIGLIIIDYLQLITSFELDLQKGRKKDFSMIVRLLQVLAKSINSPILLLSSLPRWVEERGGDKRPLLNDLLEYGTIENYIDVVLFLYRHSYYGITEDDEGNNIENRGEILINQNRNGKTGIVQLQYDFDKTGFKDFNYEMRI